MTTGICPGTGTMTMLPVSPNCGMVTSRMFLSMSVLICTSRAVPDRRPTALPSPARPALANWAAFERRASRDRGCPAGAFPPLKESACERRAER